MRNDVPFDNATNVFRSHTISTYPVTPGLSVLFLGPRKQQPAVSQPFLQFDNNQRGFPYLFIRDPLFFIQRFWKAIMPCPCKNRQRWEVKALRGGIKNELRIVPVSSPMLWSLSLLSPPSPDLGKTHAETKWFTSPFSSQVIKSQI